jgi:hypothetical protein
MESGNTTKDNRINVRQEINVRLVSRMRVPQFFTWLLIMEDSLREPVKCQLGSSFDTCDASRDLSEGFPKALTDQDLSKAATTGSK